MNDLKVMLFIFAALFILLAAMMIGSYFIAKWVPDWVILTMTIAGILLAGIGFASMNQQNRDARRARIEELKAKP